MNLALFDRATALLAQVNFPGYTFQVDCDVGAGIVRMQGSYYEPDALTGYGTTLQKTRKWLLSAHMTDSEIVFTAFKLCLTSMEHRTREFFTYRGERIASPHFDVEDLVKLCRAGRADAGART